MSGRILCVTSSLPRWAGDSTTPFVLHLAQDLQALGWQVDLLAPHAEGAARTETLDGVAVERFRYSWPVRTQTVCYGGGALANLRSHPMDRLKVPALVAAEWVAAARRLARVRYDLLHSHWILPQGFVGMLARRATRIPHVVTVHGGDIFGLRGRLMESLKRRVLEGADAVTVNSSQTEAAVRALAPRVGLLERIPMGVATEPLDSAGQGRAAEIRARHRRGAGPLVIFVGRLVDEKGPADLLAALAQLSARLPDATALVVGDGPDRANLEALARNLGLADRVAFPGWIASKELGAWLAAADFFAGPSRRAPNGWVEAQGLAFLEAMIAGIPVIATRLGGTPDVVMHERTGLLVDERAPEQIAASIVRLVEDPALARTLAEQAHRHALENFSRARSAQAMAGLFTEVMQRARKPANAPRRS
jgi:glycosyltransferase involved in cell wall biosynthesis